MKGLKRQLRLFGWLYEEGSVNSRGTYRCSEAMTGLVFNQILNNQNWLNSSFIVNGQNTDLLP